MSMGVDSRVLERIERLEKSFDELRSRDEAGSNLFTATRVPFAGSNGKLTTDSLFNYDTSAKNLAIDTARIGRHPTYGNTYAAFWRNNGSNLDYVLLASDTHTYFNAPTGSTIRFRINNADQAVLQANWFNFVAAINTGGSFRGGFLDIGYNNGQAVHIGDYYNGFALGEQSDVTLRIWKTSSGTAVSTPIVITSTALGVGVVPAFQFQVQTDSAGKPGTNTWSVVSDQGSKRPESIHPYTQGLDFIANLPDPVYFKYNGEFDTPIDDVEYVGFIAQDLQPRAGSLVRSMRGQRQRILDATDEQGKRIVETEDLGEYLVTNLNELQYAVVNALKEVRRRLIALERPNDERNNNQR